MAPLEYRRSRWRTKGHRQALACLTVVAFILAGLPQAFAARLFAAEAAISHQQIEIADRDILTDDGTVILESQQQNAISIAKRRAKARAGNLATEPPDLIELPAMPTPDRVVLGPASFPIHREIAARPAAHPYEALAPPSR